MAPDPTFHWAAYRRRRAVERLVTRLKWWRQIATRCTKRAADYRAIVTLGVVLFWPWERRMLEAVGKRLVGIVGPRRLRRAGAAAALGGLLWVPYGMFEMLQPWGADTVYRDDRGYEVVTDALRYWVYGLPGSLALLLTALGLLGGFARPGWPSGRLVRSGLVLAYVALALGALSVAGLVVLFDPLFTAPRILGTLALGAATILAGVEAHRAAAARGWASGLVILGLLGLFLLPLWPLVYAVEVVPEGGGAAIIALFGLGWVLVGYGLWSRSGTDGGPAPS